MGKSVRQPKALNSGECGSAQTRQESNNKHRNKLQVHRILSQTIRNSNLGLATSRWDTGKSSLCSVPQLLHCEMGITS